MKDHELSAVYLLEQITKAVAEVERKWNENKISGSRPAHIRFAVETTLKNWFELYLNALEETTKSIHRKAKKLETKNNAFES